MTHQSIANINKVDEAPDNIKKVQIADADKISHGRRK